MMSSQPSAMARDCRDEFIQLTGEKPRWLAMAPGRVNFIGEHIDYNDGWVLPMAINRGTYIAASPLPGTTAVLTSSAQSEILHIDLTDPIGSCTAQWGKYPSGVIVEFMRECALPIQGFRAHIHSDIPLGGGLSSSAALEVAMATLLESITGFHLEPQEKARLCQRAESEQVGVPCGIMDQMISVMGQENTLLLLDCITQECRYIPFQSGHVSLLIADTGVSHALKDGEYALRREQSLKALTQLGCSSYRDIHLEHLEESKSKLDTILYRRARHVITEIQRTRNTVQALEASDWEQTGKYLYESHGSLAKDYEVSCSELDFMVDTFQALGIEQGVYGARMTGGGFGGCAIALIHKEQEDSIIQEIKHAYVQEFSHKPDFFITSPCAGATMLSP